ncbi:nicotinate phosphoribosyltransferase-like isoform X2 [Panonychus citri]|uniref:nicotinate phosphoribosyltransferase-like isoform X2 n=1 Tax=Panonychus citri TaxID=50023 RepID=UPI0023078F9E|nr:nicotinate phosphoribosyltransferase-like isoform X2 [Panonychus citri]
MTSNGFVSNVIQPLLTDLYEVTMAYSFWKDRKHDVRAVFDLFFRRNPFQGEFTVFAGLKDCLLYLEGFRFSPSDISYLKTKLPSTVEPEFYDYLASLTASDVSLYAVDEGTIVFPKVPLISVEGPLAIVQLLETTFLTLINFASLVATNAARYRLAAPRDVKLFEFGLRRAQGPDGGLSASKYAFIGGFDGTSNLLAGKAYGIPVTGTHAHSFVMTYSSMDQLNSRTLKHANDGVERDFVGVCYKWRTSLSNFLNINQSEANEGELAAFIAYAQAFPSSFVALVDTYNVCSGLFNFSVVALALNEFGFRPIGIRIDSGDLAYLSREAHRIFESIANHYNFPWFCSLQIIASNDINEDTIHSLNDQGHRITCFAIGTHLVTCQKQPALGCVYKLTEINSSSCIKLSEDLDKVTIPGRKNVYRLFGRDGFAILDLLTKCNEKDPQVNERILCRHPILESKRAHVTPAKVTRLHERWWYKGKIARNLPDLSDVKRKVEEGLNTLRPDMKRHLNPTPYKVSVTETLYGEMHSIWLEKAPIGELY